jgi:hypothetical protein
MQINRRSDLFYCCKVTRRCLPAVLSGTETKAQGCAENLIAVEVPAGSTMTLRANFDYAATSIAHFTIVGYLACS